MSSINKDGDSIAKTILFFCIFVVVPLVILIVHGTGFGNKLMNMDENIALTKQFNLNYKGRKFESLKMKCGAEDADIQFRVGGRDYDFEAYSGICLYSPPRYEADPAAYLEIVRKPGDSFYKIMTTGEELRDSYYPGLINRLTKIIEYSYRVVDEDDYKKESWLDAS